MGRPLVAVLAAGRGTRFGGGKLEAPCAGKALGRWVIEAAEAAGLERGIIVTGPEGVSFAEGWSNLVNPRPENGQASSIARAASYALSVDADMLLILLGDMPLLSSDYLHTLANSPLQAATRYPDGGPGSPALLDRELIGLAARLSGDWGARPLLSRAIRLDAPAGSLMDVDTPEDLAEAERQLLAR